MTILPEQILIKPRIGRVLLPAKWSWATPRDEKFTDWDLWFLSEGEATLTLNDSIRTPLRRGSMLLIPPNTDCDILHGDKPSFISFFHFDILHGLLPNANHTGMHAFFREPSFIETMIQRLWEATHSGPNDDESRMWLASLLNELSLKHARYEENPLTQALRHLGDDIRRSPEDITLVSDLATNFQLSHSHFIRVFRRVHGCSPKAFIVQARLERACHLLNNSRISITSIAEEVGYSDIFSFSKQFRSRYGLSPKQWRQSL